MAFEMKDGMSGIERFLPSYITRMYEERGDVKLHSTRLIPLSALRPPHDGVIIIAT